MSTKLLRPDQLTAAALAAVLKYPVWAYAVAGHTHEKIIELVPNYVKSMDPPVPHDGIRFMQWLQTELQHKLDPQDIRDVLLTIKNAYDK